jgi:hypothetical protein
MPDPFEAPDLFEAPDPFAAHLRTLLDRTADRVGFPTADQLYHRLEVRHMHRVSLRWMVSAGVVVVAVVIVAALLWLPRAGHVSRPVPPVASVTPIMVPSLPACAPRFDDGLLTVEPVKIAPFQYELPPAALLPLVSYVPLSASVCRYAPRDDPKAPFALTASAVLAPEQSTPLVSALNSLPAGLFRVPCPFDHGDVDVIRLLRPDSSVHVVQRHRSGCGTVTDGLRYHHDTPELAAALDAALHVGRSR